MTIREPLLIGELNDGIEPQYPGSDVPRLSQYAQVIFGQELDRRLSDQLPKWDTYQGDPANADMSTLGLAIKTDLMDVENVFWTRMGTLRSYALTVRADYLGCPLSLVTTKRPALAHAENWPMFDTYLGQTVRAESNAGRIVIVGLDANEANSLQLQSATKCMWTAPYPTSVVGFLLGRGVGQLATTQLHSDGGEHAPVLGLVKVPLLEAA